MKRIRKIISYFFVSIVLFTPAYSQVKWIVTTEKMPWKANGDLVIEKYDATNQHMVEILPSEKLQQIDGFGGCFNERGMDALSILPEGKRQEVIKQLFDPITGCAFNLGRMPIGSNDYSMDSYSLNDTPEDYEMKNFSIERDKKYLIPYIKLAMKYNANLKIWGSPWCPPAWMKVNNHYAFNGPKEDCRIRWEPKILTAYALYFEKYVKAYRNEGINVYAVHVQNEPFSCQNFPSCVWNGAQMRDFIRDYLGPKLTGLNTEIWLGTINNGNYDECAGIVLKDPGATKYIKGIGYQWAGKNAIATTAAKHPGIKLMETESECGGSENNLKAAIYTFGLIDHYFKAGANSYMYWNMVLDRSGLSTWGWPQNSMISVNRGTLEVTYNMEFYVMKHFAHFIKSGASRLSTTGYDENVMAFINPDKEIVMVLMNDTQFKKTYAVKIDNKMFKADVPEYSFNSFSINKSE